MQLKQTSFFFAFEYNIKFIANCTKNEKDLDMIILDLNKYNAFNNVLISIKRQYYLNIT